MEATGKYFEEIHKSHFVQEGWSDFTFYVISMSKAVCPIKVQTIDFNDSKVLIFNFFLLMLTINK